MMSERIKLPRSGMSGVVGSGLLFGLHAAPSELLLFYSVLEAINMALLTELGFAHPWFSSFVLPIAIPVIFPMFIANGFLSFRSDVRLSKSSDRSAMFIANGWPKRIKLRRSGMSGVVGSGLLFGLHAAPTELGKFYSEVEAINMALLTELGFARPWFSSFVFQLRFP